MPDKDNARSDSDATYAADQSTYDATTGKLKKLGPDTKKLSDLADVASRARLGSTAGKGLGARGDKDTAGMPKQEPGETAGAFGARMSQWRDEKRAGQKKAFEPIVAEK